MFWVISVYFNIRNTLPKSGTFLQGHPVYVHLLVCYLNKLQNARSNDKDNHFDINIEMSSKKGLRVSELQRNATLFFGPEEGVACKIISPHAPPSCPL